MTSQLASFGQWLEKALQECGVFSPTAAEKERMRRTIEDGLLIPPVRFDRDGKMVLQSPPLPDEVHWPNEDSVSWDNPDAQPVADLAGFLAWDRSTYVARALFRDPSFVPDHPRYGCCAATEASGSGSCSCQPDPGAERPDGPAPGGAGEA